MSLRPSGRAVEHLVLHTASVMEDLTGIEEKPEGVSAMPGHCTDSHNNANEEGQIHPMALLVQHLKTICLISKFTAPSKFTRPASGTVASSQPLFVRVSYIL